MQLTDHRGLLQLMELFATLEGMADQHAHAPARTQLAWLVSWDGLMHGFTRDQEDPDFAVIALCGHISRPASVRQDQATQCGGCLVVYGRAITEDGGRWR